MASKNNDDMPVKTPHVAIPPEDASFWPEIDAGDSSRGFSTPWTQAIKDVIKFLDIEEPYSAEADEDGIQLAEFLIEHADLSIAIKEMKSKLIKESGVDEVQVTYFKNWAGTRQGMVLYARPTYIRDVKKLVKACGELGIKVSFFKCNSAFQYGTSKTLHVANIEFLIAVQCTGWLWGVVPHLGSSLP